MVFHGLYGREIQAFPVSVILNHGWQQILKCVSTHALRCVYLWWIHVDIWQNQYNIVKLKKKLKKRCSVLLFSDLHPTHHICATFCSGFPIIECCWCYSMENNRPQRKFMRYTHINTTLSCLCPLGYFWKGWKQWYVWLIVWGLYWTLYFHAKWKFLFKS